MVSVLYAFVIVGLFALLFTWILQVSLNCYQYFASRAAEKQMKNSRPVIIFSNYLYVIEMENKKLNRNQINRYSESLQCSSVNMSQFSFGDIMTLHKVCISVDFSLLYEFVAFTSKSHDIFILQRAIFLSFPIICKFQPLPLVLPQNQTNATTGEPAKNKNGASVPASGKPNGKNSSSNPQSFGNPNFSWSDDEEEVFPPKKQSGEPAIV